jgi:hypothetical protein
VARIAGVDGVAETTRAMGKYGERVRRDTKAPRRASEVAVTAVRSIGPNRTGALAASWRPGAKGVRSKRPAHAATIEHGSRPRGIVAQRRVARAIRAHQADIQRAWAGELDAIAKDEGLA